ncbi:uncharacterized protein LOC124286817 isoform X2 [Haliotis rubra]|uniref:uncharacterized protein LOC124286817 isoform X2 n=1 Tax=Haliotis rubra TaxID=36100 RepID=UPI001EE5FA61|nr:uncharacterized protein LOC124286817 isoform X2 [Haliotis rubra]
MQNVSLFVVVYLAVWIQDDCLTVDAAKPKHPFTVAREAIRNEDKSPSYLHIVDFGPQGTGVVAGKDFSPSDFITYYHGKHSSERPDLDDHEYEFLFKLNHYHKSFWIDASEEDGSYGRLFNDDWKNPNARARVIFVDGQAHVAFLARRSIKAGEEIRYNYKHGATDFPWRQPKKHPFAEAREAIRNTDASPSYLHIEYFGTHKGRGIVAGKYFSHGDFITYYHGKHSPEEPDLTNEEHDYLFKLNHYFKSFWIDASEEDGSYGRLFNDDWKNPNARARVIFVDGQAHVAFLARRSIKTGEEIRFDYNHGATHFPWRQLKKAATGGGEGSRSSDESSLDLQEKSQTQWTHHQTETWLDLLKTIFMPTCMLENVGDNLQSSCSRSSSIQDCQRWHLS